MWSPWAPGSAVGALKQDLSVGGTENADMERSGPGIPTVQVQELCPRAEGMLRAR